VIGGPGGRGDLLLLATLSGFLVLVHSLVLTAGLLGHLTADGLGLVLVGAGATAVVLWRRRDHGLARVEAAEWSAAKVFAPLAALVAMLAWARPHLIQATRLRIWDDYTYHMVYPALWLREHAIAAPSPADTCCRPASSPPGSWRRGRARAVTRWRGSASPARSTRVWSSLRLPCCSGAWAPARARGRCPRFSS
jgi:hypothetical protein